MAHKYLQKAQKMVLEETHRLVPRVASRQGLAFNTDIHGTLPA